MKREQTVTGTGNQERISKFPQNLPLMMDLKDIPPAEMAIIKERVEAWYMKYPDGEPMCKRDGTHGMYIDTLDIEMLFNTSERSAQRFLQNTRFVLEKKKTGYVTVNEFCAVNDLVADDVWDFLDKESENKWKIIAERKNGKKKGDQ